MKLNDSEWKEFIESFRGELEQVDDMWKDTERSYRDYDGDIINYKKYENLNVWRLSNIINYVIDFDKDLYVESVDTIEKLAQSFIDMDDYFEDCDCLMPYNYHQTDGHLEVISFILCELNSDEHDSDGIRPHVLERYNALLENKKLCESIS